MTSAIFLKYLPLKNFLQLFSAEAAIEIIDFGDTWHPSSGYVDQSILGNPKTVSDLLNFDYDFKGLVGFTAVIEGYHVEYSYEPEGYKIVASPKDIERLIRKIEAFNMLSRDIKYEWQKLS